MIQKVDEQVGVITIYDVWKNRALPWCIKWKNKRYFVKKLTMLHQYYEGRTLIHVFSVFTGSMYFRLEFNTQSLQWWLKETDDGYTN